MADLCIKCLNSEIKESGAIYGQFSLDLLNPGQAVTIGTLLRRMLLSSLGGTAITAVRIAGATHEFSTIDGIREDILEILLNLKGVVLKNKSTGLCSMPSSHNRFVFHDNPKCLSHCHLI